MATATYHHIDGISPTESYEIKKLLYNKMPDLGRSTRDRIYLNAILFYKEAYPKLKALAKFIANHETRTKEPANCFNELQKIRMKLEVRWYLDLRYDRGIRNKAATMKVIDDFARDFIMQTYPNNKKLVARCKNNLLRWASKKIPGERKNKPGPKPGTKRRMSYEQTIQNTDV